MNVKKIIVREGLIIAGAYLMGMLFFYVIGGIEYFHRFLGWVVAIIYIPIQGIRLAF